MNGFQNAFSYKGFGFKHVEGAGIEHLAAGVLDPQRSQWSRLCVPQRNLLRVDVRLQDGHERRLVLADRDLLLDLVFEEISGGLALGLGALLFCKRRDRSGRSLDRWSLPSYLHRLARRSQVQRGVDLVVATDAKVDIRKVESLKACGIHENCGISRLNI